MTPRQPRTTRRADAIAVATNAPAADNTVDYDADHDDVAATPLTTSAHGVETAAQIAQAERIGDLEALIQRMDRFLGMANHEMKTPLTTLNANLQLATRRLRRMAEQVAAQTDSVDTVTNAETIDAVIGMLDRAQGAARRMTRLVNELLDVSRIQTGRLELHLEPCDVVALARDVIAEAHQGGQGRVIHLELAGDVGLVLADPDRTSEVLDNYLSNALKYAPADRPIIVTVAPTDDDAARVSVRDEGPGVSPETQARIWNVFERLNADASQHASGVNLGLGLHICKTIIELQGGAVGVESVLGAGATFWFTLPIVASEGGAIAKR